MQEITTTLNGIDVTAEYKVYGKYMPATRIDPEEYPEVILKSVRIIDLDIDILDLLSEKQQNQILDEIESNL